MYVYSIVDVSLDYTLIPGWIILYCIILEYRYAYCELIVFCYIVYGLVIAISTVRIIVGCCLTAGFSGSPASVVSRESCDEFVSSSSSSV